MLGGGFLHEADWLAPPSPSLGRAALATPCLAQLWVDFSQVSSQHHGVRPDMQDLLPQGPLPIIELCLLSLHQSDTPSPQCPHVIKFNLFPGQMHQYTFSHPHFSQAANILGWQEKYLPLLVSMWGQGICVSICCARERERGRPHPRVTGAGGRCW